MVGIKACLIPISTSSVTINTFSNLVKGILADLLRPTYASFTITPNVSYLKLSYTQQSTIVTWVMVVIVADLGPMYNSPITTNSFSRISRGEVSGLFRPISTYTIINSYIPPQVTIITTSVSPLFVIIITDITILF